MFSKILTKKLTPKSKKIVDYMEKNVNKVMHMSISNFARDMNVHPSFLTKTLKKVGYYGWKDWQAFCLKDIISFSHNTNYGKYLDKTLISSIINVMNNIDMLKINSVVKEIINKKVLFWVGNGYSLFIAKDQNRRYGAIGYKSCYIDEKTGEIASVDDKSIIFIISISGYTSLTEKQLQYLIRKKCTLIMITASSDVTYTKYYKFILAGSFIDNMHIIENKIPRHSRIIIYCILDLVFVKLFNKNEDENNRLLNMSKEH